MNNIEVDAFKREIGSALTQHWLNQSYFETTIFNCLSLAFPIGERGLIKSIKEHLPLVDDPKLATSMREFIKEEIQHSKLHSAYNDCLKQVKSYDIEKMEAAHKRLYRDVAQLDKRQRLAFTVAVEYLTASIADYSLDRYFTEVGSQTLIKRFWRWHGKEEIGHQHTARRLFDAIYTDEGLLSNTLQQCILNLSKVFRLNLAQMVIADGKNMNEMKRWLADNLVGEQCDFYQFMQQRLANFD